MNVYDAAHTLASSVKESEEYKQYMNAKQVVAQNAELNEMLADFQAKQFQMQAKQMMGEDAGEEMMGSIQELYGIMMRDPMAAQYLQCEMRFSLMMNDVYKILGEVMGLGQQNNG